MQLWVAVVIYEGLYFDLAQGQMNGAPNETIVSSSKWEKHVLIWKREHFNGNFCTSIIDGTVLS